MRFTRLVSTFAATAAISMLAIAGCSSSENKATPGGGGDEATGGKTAGTAGKTSVAGAATTTTTTPKGGSAGAATTTTIPSAAGAGGAATTTTTTQAAGAGAGGVTTTTTAPTAGKGGTGGTTTTTAVGGSTGVAGSGAGGTTSTGNTLDDLIGAICGWEFKCCSTGEAKWELGPDVTSAAACKARFVDLLHNNNSPANPYPSTSSKDSTGTTWTGNSPAINGLLISLAYEINPNRVTENPTGIAACIAEWTAKTCNAAAVASTKIAHCTTTSYDAVAACSLGNLVTPKQKASDPCTDVASLKQGAGNDIECVAGTSCISANTEDNLTATTMCITRGVANGSCAKDSECDFNFYCASGKCTAKGSLGDTCAYQTPAAPKPNLLSAPCKPGLECNPNTLKCVANCTNGFVCVGAGIAGDAQCPTGSSCLPATVPGNDSTSFTICGAVGAEGAKCNSLDDCATGLYCDGSVCTAQKATGAACTTTIEGNCLPPNLYCKATTVGGTAGTCTLFTDAGVACTQTAGTVDLPECSPVNAKTGCVAKGDGTGSICSSSLLALGKQCNGNWDCASERCEFATIGALSKTCIAGAAVGAACLPAAGTAAPATNVTTCAAGLTCKAGSCVAQVGPGGSCESTTTAGATDATLCTNASCNKTWWTTTSATVIMCTDATVTTFNGGTGVICDGK